MKKLSFMIVAALLATTALISCKKEGDKTTSKNTQNSSKQSDSLTIDSVIYYDAAHNLINSNNINQNLDYCLLVEPVNNHVAQAIYFPNESDFYSFISSNSNYDEVKNRIDFIRNIRDLCVQYNVDLESDATPPQEIEDYINSWNESTTMRTTKTTGTGVLREHYTHPVYHGGSSGFAIYPRWTLGGFRNKASGVQLSGVTILWDKRWFGGASVTAVGFPYGQVPLVAQYGLDFNDRAESLF